MTVLLARLDQRLIHGITVEQWGKTLNINRFMVIDDEISKDETIKASMRMSKPMGTGMSIIDTQKAIRNFNNGNYDNQRVLILVREPETLVQLLNNGVKFPKLNLGITFNEGDRKPITKFIALNDKEKKDIDYIKQQGIPVFFQYVPSDPEEPYKG